MVFYAQSDPSVKPARQPRAAPAFDTLLGNAQASAVDRTELRRWIGDALSRHDRDARERDEAVANVTADEIVDAVWGRLPLDVRRQTTRAQVQASLTMLTARRGVQLARDDADVAPGIES
jgi:hypothetical protein